MSGANATTNPSIVPLRPPPPGRQSNFVNPESRAYQSQVTFGICIVLVVVVLALRIHRRLIVTKDWGWDDWFCVGATLAYLAFGACRLSWMEKWGARLWDTPASQATDERLAQQWLAEGALYVVATMLVKISILLLYLRLFEASATTRRLIYGGAAAVTLFYAAFVALQLALCRPRRGESAFSPAVARRCSGSWKPRYFAFSAFNIASDVYIVALPVRVVWRLQMDRRRKIAVTALFVMGLLACICAVLRVLYALPSIADEDDNWEVIQNNSIGYSEVTLGIVCCCLPVVWKTLKSAWNRVAARFSTPRLPSSSASPARFYSIKARRQGAYNVGRGGGGSSASNGKTASHGSVALESSNSVTAVMVTTNDQQQHYELSEAETALSGVSAVYVHRQFGFSYRNRGSCHDDEGERNAHGGCDGGAVRQTWSQA